MQEEMNEKLQGHTPKEEGRGGVFFFFLFFFFFEQEQIQTK